MNRERVMGEVKVRDVSKLKEAINNRAADRNKIWTEGIGQTTLERRRTGNEYMIY